MGIKTKDLPLAVNAANLSLVGDQVIAGTPTTVLAPLVTILASPALTGIPTTPTAATGTNTTQIASTAFVIANAPAAPVSSVFTRTGAVVAAGGDYSVGQVTGAAPLASPAFTGTPTAPTAAPGDRSTVLATTAFVQNLFDTENFKPAAYASTITTLPTYVYNNGVSGVGATITFTGLGPLTVDGVTFTTVGQNALVKNETAGNAPFNGLYSVQVVGVAAVSSCVLIRNSDMNTPGEFVGALIPVLNGTTLAGQTWLCSTAPAVIGTNNVAFTVWTAPVTGVTSVGLSLPAEFTVSGSPVTTTGTLTAVKANQNANLVYAGPNSGAAAVPTFRALAVADIPTNSLTALTISSGVVNIDCSLGDFFTLALSANVTSITFSNFPAAGKATTKMVQITQNASAAKTVAFPASFKWPGGTIGVVSSALSAVDLVAFSTFDQGTTWRANLANAYA